MGSYLHNYYVHDLSKSINASLRIHRSGKGLNAQLAQAVRDITFDVRFPEKEGNFRPDWQWGFMLNPYPGVVLEVGYSQSGIDLQEKAKDYLCESYGEINAVLTVDIEYIAPEPPSTISTAGGASATLWRKNFPSDTEVQAVSVETLVG